MIGVSLSYGWLLEGEVPEEMLTALWEIGARSIELRMVPANEDPENVLRVANFLWDAGFKITIHAKSRSVETAIEDILYPLKSVLARKRQKDFTVTIHPIQGDNAALLVKLSDYIIKENYPVRIGLENERRLPGKVQGDSLALVLDAVTRANRDNVGITFDMGHLAWFYEMVANTPDALPPKEFLDKVIHTHIHACVDGQTHFPLETRDGAYAEYIKALGFNYFGVYNIEISPGKYKNRFSDVEGFVLSVNTLRENFPFTQPFTKSAL